MIIDHLCRFYLKFCTFSEERNHWSQRAVSGYEINLLCGREGVFFINIYFILALQIYSDKQEILGLLERSLSNQHNLYIHWNMITKQSLSRTQGTGVRSGHHETYFLLQMNVHLKKRLNTAVEVCCLMMLARQINLVQIRKVKSPCNFCHLFFISWRDLLNA